MSLIISNFWCRWKYFMQTIFALGISILFVGILCVTNASRFSVLRKTDFIDGMTLSSKQSVFYLRSSSSQGVRTEKLAWRDLPCIRGESVALEIMQFSENSDMGTGKSVADVEKIAELLAKKFDAKILFIEDVCGVKSYYCYTKKWLNGVILNGVKINLHIALRVCADGCVNDEEGLCVQGVIGSPIIFDGY